jgi:hypothetical protein
MLQGDQKVLYEYYGVIKKSICILRGDQKVGTNITERPKFGMNITG